MGTKGNCLVAHFLHWRICPLVLPAAQAVGRVGRGCRDAAAARSGCRCSPECRREPRAAEACLRNGVRLGASPPHTSRRGLPLHVSTHLVPSTCLPPLVFWGVEWPGGLKWLFLATRTDPVAALGGTGPPVLQ